MSGHLCLKVEPIPYIFRIILSDSILKLHLLIFLNGSFPSVVEGLKCILLQHWNSLHVGKSQCLPELFPQLQLFRKHWQFVAHRVIRLYEVVTYKKVLHDDMFSKLFSVVTEVLMYDAYGRLYIKNKWSIKKFTLEKVAFEITK